MQVLVALQRADGDVVIAKFSDRSKERYQGPIRHSAQSDGRSSRGVGVNLYVTSGYTLRFQNLIAAFTEIVRSNFAVETDGMAQPRDTDSKYRGCASQDNVEGFSDHFAPQLWQGCQANSHEIKVKLSDHGDRRRRGSRLVCHGVGVSVSVLLRLLTK